MRRKTRAELGWLCIGRRLEMRACGAASTCATPPACGLGIGPVASNYQRNRSCTRRLQEKASSPVPHHCVPHKFVGQIGVVLGALLIIQCGRELIKLDYDITFRDHGLHSIKPRERHSAWPFCMGDRLSPCSYIAGQLYRRHEHCCSLLTSKGSTATGAIHCAPFQGPSLQNTRGHGLFSSSSPDTRRPPYTSSTRSTAL